MKKHFFLIIFFISTNISIAQETSKNQIDTNGLRQGQWEAHYANGQLRYEGQFVDGKEIGVFKHYYENGNLKVESDFVEPGVKSESKVYADSGKLIAEGAYVNQQKDGEWRFYDEESGVLILTEAYYDGWRHGLSKSYFPNGNVQEITTFNMDNKEGLWQSFNEDGSSQSSGFYLGNQFHGEGKFYYPNGVLREEGNFENGRKVGIWRTYDDDGYLISEDLYDEE